MRIGMVTACYKPVINGVTRMVSAYKEHLEAAGQEVTVFTWGEPDPAGEEQGVIRSPGIPIGDDGYYFNIRYSRMAQQRMQEMDIIHCHHLFMSLEMAHRYAQCPIIYTNHTRYDLYTSAYTPLPQPAADALMRQIWPEFTDLCDVVVAPSSSLCQVMQEFGVRQPMEVIENGVDLHPFHYPQRPLSKGDLRLPETAVLAVFVGRLAAEKKLDNLLTQFAVAQNLVPDLHLLLVGHGTQRDALQRQAHRLDLADHIHFTGPVAYDDVANYLAAADLFVTASVSEVHPLTVIEAMAAGLPVAAVSSPGLVDTVTNGESGFLTRYGEQGGLAAAIVALAIDDERRQRMAAAAQTASRRFDIRHTIGRTLALYERLCETRPDLSRDRAHGRRRWQRGWPESWQPWVGQLARLIRLEVEGHSSQNHDQE